MKKLDKAAQVVIVHPKTKKILGVSRKTDHSDFGLPGGKFEISDINPVFTIKRELEEETGLKIETKLFELVNQEPWGGREQYTYVAEYNGDKLFTREPHVVDWVDAQTLVDGSFGEYNKKVLTDLGLYCEN